MQYKILFISSWFPSKIEPTNGNFVQRHAETVALLHEVEILHAIGDPYQKEIYLFDRRTINGIKTVVVYYKKTPNPLLNFIRRMNSYKKGFSYMQKPDLVHANILQKPMIFAVYLKMKFHIPFIVSEHWSGFLNINKNKLPKFQLFVAKFIAKHAAFVLPVSHYLLNDLKRLGLNSRFEVIENVVDTNLFQAKSEKAEKFVFLHISNLVPLKNPQKIIMAAVRLRKEFPDFELHIGGDGDVESLEKLIHQKNAENFIKTFSTLPLPDVAEKMRNSNCFILFSDYENFPCVLLESLASGTPAIATKVGGIPEIIGFNNGILISNSEEELFAAMKKVLQNKISFEAPEQLHQFVEDNYSMQIIAKKFDQIYTQILSR